MHCRCCITSINIRGRVGHHMLTSSSQRCNLFLATYFIPDFVRDLPDISQPFHVSSVCDQTQDTAATLFYGSRLLLAEF